MILASLLLTSCWSMTVEEIEQEQAICIAWNTRPQFIEYPFGQSIVCQPIKDTSLLETDLKQIEYCREHNMNYEHSAWDWTINCIPFNK